MAWQFNSEGMGAAIGKGLQDAEDSISKEKERLRQQAIDDLAGADKYKKRKTDASGNTIGYESDTDARAKAIDFVRRRLPGYRKQDAAPATTIKPYQQVMAEQGLNPATGAPAAPPPPTPLLENPNKGKLEDAQMARAQEVTEAEKDRQQAELNAKRKEAQSVIKGVGAGESYAGSDGKDYKVKPVKQAVSFDDMTVVGGGPKEEPAGVDPSMVDSVPPPLPIDVPAEEPDPLDVDDYTLRRLVDQVTSPSVTKDGVQNQMIMSDQLDPELQKRLGVQGLSIPLPFSFVARGIQAQTAQQDKSIGAETYDAVAELEAGVPYSVVSRKLSKAWNGKIPPQVAQELRSARAAIASEGQRAVTNQVRAEAQTEKSIDKQDRALERFRKEYDATGILSAVPALEIIEKETGAVSGSGRKDKLPGYGTNALRSLPFVGNAAATVAAKQYGGAKTQQALQALLNAVIKDTSGQAVTKYEEGRILLAQGMGMGGNEEDVSNGIKMMVEGLKEAAGSVKAGFPEEVLNSYKKGGGKFPSIIFGKDAEKQGMKYEVTPKGGKEQVPEASRKRIDAAKKLGIGSQPGQPGLEGTLNAIDNAPRPGDVVDGYRYKGGNPAEQKNWEAVK